MWDELIFWYQITGCLSTQVAAHEADVNVISWNRLAAFMMASGGDDGTLRVWDLRSFAAGAHVASFAYHKCGHHYERMLPRHDGASMGLIRV